MMPSLYIYYVQGLTVISMFTTTIIQCFHILYIVLGGSFLILPWAARTPPLAKLRPHSLIQLAKGWGQAMVVFNRNVASFIHIQFLKSCFHFVTEGSLLLIRQIVKTPKLSYVTMMAMIRATSSLHFPSMLNSFIEIVTNNQYPSFTADAKGRCL